MIAIIDYDAGNIKSVEKAFQFLGEEAVLTRDREVILNADRNAQNTHKRLRKARKTACPYP